MTTLVRLCAPPAAYEGLTYTDIRQISVRVPNYQVHETLKGKLTALKFDGKPVSVGDGVVTIGSRRTLNVMLPCIVTNEVMNACGSSYKKCTN